MTDNRTLRGDRGIALRSGSGSDFLSRSITFVRSNSSVVGAFLVIAALFFTQRYAGAWLTDSSVVDESDIVAFSVAAVPVAGDETSCEPWLLTFSDDFNGDAVDDSRWLRYNSPNRDGNGVRRPDAITVEDGILVVTGRAVDGEIVSGGLASNHPQMYGRFEARVRTEADPGGTMSGTILTWPAGNNHPEGGQNDLYATLGSAGADGSVPTPFNSRFHHSDGTFEEIVHDGDAGEWHELAMEWTPEAITVFRDAELVGTITEPDAIADHPHVLAIELNAVNTEMGDNTVRMHVDWVRIHQRNESPPADC